MNTRLIQLSEKTSIRNGTHVEKQETRTRVRISGFKNIYKLDQHSMHLQ